MLTDRVERSGKVKCESGREVVDSDFFSDASEAEDLSEARSAFSKVILIHPKDIFQCGFNRIIPL